MFSASIIRILYCGDDLIIADKPVNTVVHGRTDGAMTLLDDLRRQLEAGGLPVPFLAPSNRLDRNTGGPVVFSRNRETAIVLRRMFAHCEIEKTYHARLDGVLREPLFVQADIIRGCHRKASVKNLQILRDSFPDKQAWFDSRTANSATISGTLIMPLKTGDAATLAAIHPWTGRFHQIRAVCRAIGHPVSGDCKYGGGFAGGGGSRGVGSVREARRRAEWSNPALICKSLSIPAFGVSVESGFEIVL